MTAEEGDDGDASLSESPPRLAADTQALLNQFLAQKAETEREMQEYSASSSEDRISPADFIKLFSEDWQLSQFWYTPDFADRLAKAIRSQVDETSRIAFLCSPTAYVAYRHLYPTFGQCHLFENDERFQRFAGDEFVPYDLHLSTQLPQELVQCVDLAIVDPPFLNSRTNISLAISLKLLLKPTGRLILITSRSVEELPQIYAKPPLGPLHVSELAVEHTGLRNDFVCFTSWSEGFS